MHYTVLIADDEPIIRNGLSNALDWKSLGFDTVILASNVDQVIDYFSHTTIDLLLSDIQMPGKNGLDLLSWVHIHYPKTRIMVISGYDNFSYAQGALRFGASDYLLKPIKKAELLASVTKIYEELQFEETTSKKQQQYLRVYFLRKLLENTFISTEELQEIRQRLEILDDSSLQYVIGIFDVYGTDENAHQKIRKALSDFSIDDIGNYLISIIPENKLDTFIGLASPLEHFAIGSSQLFENLCISYESALGQIRNSVSARVHTFRSTYQEHRELMQIIDALSIGGYAKVFSCVLSKFSTFENIPSALRWCVWFMDRLEETFPNYKFTGKYQQAVKDYSGSKLFELQNTFMVYIKKVFMTFDVKKVESGSTVVNKAKSLISENLSNKNFSLTVVADSLAMSYGYLSSLFKEGVGQGFTEYLCEQRMKKAAILLAEKKYKIYEIADMCGYSNYRYFTDLFKKYWGMPPSEYRTPQ